jgi:hypothetical protein
VQFGVAGGVVRGRVVGIDAQARKDLPLGAPYRVSVFAAPPQSGYSAGTDCTIGAACLELDPTAPEYERSLAVASTVVIEPRRLPARPSVPTFLVAFMREGGNYPIQGTLLVQGETLDAANAAATTYLNAELAADVSEGRELPDAMVMLPCHPLQRIVLTRPAVEAGERLGFLPGDLNQKVDPYLRPLYDALYDLMGFDQVHKAFERQALEIAPLAFMRGRTLDNCFVILDEAQNATDLQLKMFLTRMGPTAKFIVTGDVTQVDLPKIQQSGLHTALRILPEIKGIDIIYLSGEDVVRHKLVRRILEAYGDIQK